MFFVRYNWVWIICVLSFVEKGFWNARRELNESLSINMLFFVVVIHTIDDRSVGRQNA